MEMKEKDEDGDEKLKEKMEIDEDEEIQKFEKEYFFKIFNKNKNDKLGKKTLRPIFIKKLHEYHSKVDKNDSDV
jgi:hypothetical protein